MLTIGEDVFYSMIQLCYVVMSHEDVGFQLEELIMCQVKFICQQNI